MDTSQILNQGMSHRSATVDDILPKAFAAHPTDTPIRKPSKRLQSSSSRTSGHQNTKQNTHGFRKSIRSMARSVKGAFKGFVATKSVRRGYVPAKLVPSHSNIPDEKHSDTESVSDTTDIKKRESTATNITFTSTRCQSTHLPESTTDGTEPPSSSSDISADTSSFYEQIKSCRSCGAHESSLPHYTLDNATKGGLRVKACGCLEEVNDSYLVRNSHFLRKLQDGHGISTIDARMAEDDVPFAETLFKRRGDSGEHLQADGIKAGLALQSITVMEPYHEWSFEELRVADYARGRKMKLPEGSRRELRIPLPAGAKQLPGTQSRRLTIRAGVQQTSPDNGMVSSTKIPALITGFDHKHGVLADIEFFDGASNKEDENSEDDEALLEERMLTRMAPILGTARACASQSRIPTLNGRRLSGL